MKRLSVCFGHKFAVTRNVLCLDDEATNPSLAARYEIE